MGRRAALKVTGLLVAGIFCLVAWAMPPYQDALFARYPGAATALPNCIACHDGPGANTFNAFANAFLANGLVFNAALEALDSDGDGFTNGAELTASPVTGPGDPNSKPGTVGPPVTPAGSSFNYTGLWWNPAEAGWGITVNHQGDIIFATLFTYDPAGAPLWLVMSSGRLQSDGRSYSGELYRAHGSPFNAVPFVPVTAADLAPVGTMSLTFATAGTATLAYTYQGVSVSKSIVPQVFGTAAASCSASTASRAAATNYQDLWWNPAEPGWGISVAHQNDTLFATLFTYDLGGSAYWLVMSAGTKQADGSYLGDLYATRGPAFNAEPFTPLAAGDVAKVGTMRFAFSDGINGALAYTVNGASVSKPITRQVFGTTVPSCSSPSKPPTATQPQTGPDLYAAYCASCHRPLANTSKPGASLPRITGAIAGNTGGMGYLSTLTAAQLDLIVAALAVAQPPPVTDGPTLYANNCAGCHGALANSTKGGASLARIQSAITGSVGGMGYLSSLTAAQLDAIVTALASVAPPPPPPVTDGPALYATYCASCHQPLASSTKGGATATRIQTAIAGNVGGMGYLSTLTATQVGAIATALASVTPTVPAACGSCHGIPPSTGEHREHRARPCSACHGAGYSTTTVNAATHINGIKELLASIGWNPTSRSCANSCHGRESW